MAYRIIIQARLTSSRLHAKALLPIGGIPSLLLCQQRAANQDTDTVVATSVDKTDDTLAHFLQIYRVPVCRGPLDDVLARFILASNDLSKNDYIVRLTADNVFPDGSFIKALMSEMEAKKCQFLTTTYDNSYAPYGLSAEIFTVKLLRETARQTNDSQDREHVTPWMIRSASADLRARFFETDLKSSMRDFRCTLDHIDDYKCLLKVFETVENPCRIPWQDLCHLLSKTQCSLPSKK